METNRLKLKSDFEALKERNGNMKEIRIKTLELSNWRAQNKKITFSGRTVISGRNRSGKSTTKDALLWLLTGYDSEDRYNYQLFDTTVEATKENSVPAYVEGVFDIDGMEYTLKRMAEMGWSRPRGSDTYVKKTTDDYSFFRDGVALSSGDYMRFVESVFGPVQYLKFILNINYYMLLDWKALRTAFSEVIGEVNDSDYTGDYTEISRLLATYKSLDVIKEYLKQRRTPLRDSVGTAERKGSLSIEIETMRDNLPDVSEADRARERCIEIETMMLSIDKEMAGAADALQPYVERRRKETADIMKMRDDLSRREQEYEQSFRNAITDIDREIHNVNAENNLNRNQQERDKQDIAANERRLGELALDIKRLQDRRKMLLEENRRCLEQEFSGDKCSYCGQELPADMLEDARRLFEAEKEREHQEIVARGKRNNMEMERVKKEMEDISKMNGELAAKGYPAAKDTAGLDRQKQELLGSHVPFRESEEYAIMTKRIQQAEESLTEIPEADTSALRKKKEALLAEYRACSEKAGMISERDRMERRIADKEQDLKRSAVELAQIEGQLAKAEEMEREKAEIVRTRVKKFFSWCDVQMEQRQKNGGTAPACNIILEGVPSQVSNTASKMLIGIDISNAFCRYLDTSLPMIVDNMESMDDGYDMNPESRQEIFLARRDNDFMVEML